MRKLLYFVLATVIFVACGKDDFGLNSQPEPQNPYAVTPEEAVQMLQSVIGGETTRSISVSDIQTLNKSAFVPSTRSGADEEAIYIVDIEGKGSAIVSADKRMEPIYAIMDKTKISTKLISGYDTIWTHQYIMNILRAPHTAILCIVILDGLMANIMEKSIAGYSIPQKDTMILN